MKPAALSDDDWTLIAVAVAAAPALTSDQLDDLRRVFQPQTLQLSRLRTSPEQVVTRKAAA